MIKMHLMVADVRLEVEAPTLIELLEESAFLRELPKLCPTCEASLELKRRTAKNAQGKECKFYGLECTGPVTHQNTFGQHMEDNKSFFYKRDGWIVKPARRTALDEDQAPQQGGGQNRSGGYGGGGRR